MSQSTLRGPSQHSTTPTRSEYGGPQCKTYNLRPRELQTNAEHEVLRLEDLKQKHGLRRRSPTKSELIKKPEKQPLEKTFDTYEWAKIYWAKRKWEQELKEQRRKDLNRYDFKPPSPHIQARQAEEARRRQDEKSNNKKLLLGQRGQPAEKHPYNFGPAFERPMGQGLKVPQREKSEWPPKKPAEKHPYNFGPAFERPMGQSLKVPQREKSEWPPKEPATKSDVNTWPDDKNRGALWRREDARGSTIGSTTYPERPVTRDFQRERDQGPEDYYDTDSDSDSTAQRKARAREAKARRRRRDNPSDSDEDTVIAEDSQRMRGQHHSNKKAAEDELGSGDTRRSDGRRGHRPREHQQSPKSRPEYQGRDSRPPPPSDRQSIGSQLFDAIRKVL